jgi:hypothetical protein
LVEHSGDDLGAHGADALVEVRDLGGQAGAIVGDLVDGGLPSATGTC